MSAASVAVVVTSGERHEGKAGLVLFAGKLCDPCLSALCVPWCKKALYKYSSFPFLSATVESTKPEVHNALHYRQSTEPRPHVTSTEKFVKF